MDDIKGIVEFVFDVDDKQEKTLDELATTIREGYAQASRLVQHPGEMYDLMKAFASAVPELINEGLEIFDGTPKEIAYDIGKIAGFVVPLAMGAPAMYKGFKAILQSGKALGSLVKSLTAIMKNKSLSAKERAAEVYRIIKGAVAGKVGAVATAAVTQIDKIKDAFKNKVDDLKNLLKDIRVYDEYYEGVADGGQIVRMSKSGLPEENISKIDNVAREIQIKYKLNTNVDEIRTVAKNIKKYDDYYEIETFDGDVYKVYKKDINEKNLSKVASFGKKHKKSLND